MPSSKQFTYYTMGLLRIARNKCRVLTLSALTFTLIYVVLLSILPHKEQDVLSVASAQEVEVMTLKTSLKKSPARLAYSPSQNHSLWDAINTRQLVLLAAKRMNQIVQEMAKKNKSVACSKWWTNPLQVLKTYIVNSTASYNVHLLEFVASSEWENATFQVKARVYVHRRPESMQLLNQEFHRMTSTSRPCFSNETAAESWAQLCSCNQGNPPQMISKNLSSLAAWPVNASFFIGDYLNFNEPKSLFNILPSPSLCDSLNLLVIIISAPVNFLPRYTIRNTYGSKQEFKGRNASLVFLVGRAQDPNLEYQIKEEASIYQDIIQANFIDSYQNLTLKNLAMLAHVYFSCSKPSPPFGEKQVFGRTSYNPPPHVLKADDDFFLNLDVALQVTVANPDVELMGSLICDARVFRGLDSKYFVPTYIYTPEALPPFILGGTVLMRSDIFPKLLEASLTVPMIHLEDLYITGFLSNAIGIQPRNSSLFGTHYTGKAGHSGAQRYQQLHTMVNSHMDSVKEFQSTYDLFSRPPPPGSATYKRSSSRSKILTVDPQIC